MNETLTQGIAVMLIGMGTVLVFLCITIFSMIVMSKIVGKLNRIFPEAAVQSACGAKAADGADEESIAIAILAALLKK